MSSIRSRSAASAGLGYTDVPTSPVPAGLLSSGVILSAHQTDMVHETISIAQSRISHIDSEITRLMDSVGELQHKRAALLTYTKNHIALVAPIRRLPSEILSEIFLHCMDPKGFGPEYDFREQPCLDKMPLLLGEICSRWRSIALSTPRLWASLSLSIRPKYLNSDTKLAKTWLSRSGTCPLFISLRNGKPFQNNMQRLMQVLLAHCEHWYDIRLAVNMPILRALSPAKNRLPMLQKLYICMTNVDAFDIFNSAPQLRYFYLAGYNVLSKIQIPWNQLQYCDTGNLQTDLCLDLFSLTPNLVRCTVSPSGQESSEPRSPVQLPHLRSITISRTVQLLDKLLVPELHEISFRDTITTGKSAQQLTSFLLRCPVRKLSFASKYEVIHDLGQFLQASPALLELELLGWTAQSMTTSFLARFTHGNSSKDLGAPQMLPLLHTMVIDYSPSHFDILDFADSIQSRMVFDVLKRVEIRLLPHVSAKSLHSATLRRLRRLRDIGLDISVLCDNRELL